MFILKVCRALSRYKIPYALVGGHAVALHGAVRGTIDVDFITKISLKNFKLIAHALSEIGLSSRLPITPEDLFAFKDEYIKNRNLIAWNFINTKNPSEQVDVVITFDLLGKKIHKMKLNKDVINVISKADLIEMKKISGRQQDFIDIEALEVLDEKK